MVADPMRQDITSCILEEEKRKEGIEAEVK
jgi:hypothetical protein